MAEQWFAVVDDRNGELLSVATVVANPLNRGRVAIALPRQPDWGTDLWDPTTRALVPRPAPPAPTDRVDEIMADPDLTLVATLPTELTKLREVLERHLDDPAVRYRVT